MKNYKNIARLATITVLGSLLLPLMVSADDVNTSITASTTGSNDATTTTIRDIRNLSKEKLDELRAKAEQEKADIRGKIADLRQERASSTEAIKGEIKGEIGERRDEIKNIVSTKIGDFIDRVKERLTATTDRFDRIILRIDSRITKLNTSGATTTEAVSLLADAKAKLVIAKTDIVAINATTTATSTADLRTFYSSVKVQVDKTKTDLKNVQTALSLVINKLEGLRLGVQATTTTATSSESN